MPALKRASAVIVLLSALCLSSLALAQRPDQVIAARILGPRWEQRSCRAGIIFAGTVIAVPPANRQTAAGKTRLNQASRPSPGPIPSVEFTFRVDEAIAGVAPGQVLTIHEWAAAAFAQPSMTAGEHLLLFLYPPSDLGLTSPVGGPLGRIRLDATGKNIIGWPPRPGSGPIPTLAQLARAIRNARLCAFTADRFIADKPRSSQP
jgi:hypothetical protein